MMFYVIKEERILIICRLWINYSYFGVIYISDRKIENVQIISVYVLIFMPVNWVTFPVRKFPFYIYIYTQTTCFCGIYTTKFISVRKPSVSHSFIYSWFSSRQKSWQYATSREVEYWWTAFACLYVFCLYLLRWSGAYCIIQPSAID